MALALSILSIGALGCGEQADRGEREALERRQAADQRRAQKLERLRDELRARRAMLRARARQQARADARRLQADGRGEAGFSRLADELAGEAGVAIGAPSGPVLTLGALQTGSAWSTVKVPIALAALRDVGGPAGLSSTGAAEIRSALTLSDNAAAAALFATLERRHEGLTGASAAVERILREAGDSATVVATQGRGEFSTYGQTEWSLRDQHRFVSELAAGCVVDSESDRYALDLMGEVASDTWGLGSAGLPAAWKGGWGPGVDGRYLVRQMGMFYLEDKLAVVALAARPDDGQFNTAQAMATRIAEWLASQAKRHAGYPHKC